MGGGWSFCCGEIIYYLFQPSSAARCKFQILLHVYIEQLHVPELFISLPEIIYFEKNAAHPWKSNGGPLTR